MFRWIVKLIRDGYDVDEMMLVRNAVLETACGLVIEQVEAMLGVIVACFGRRFPPETLNAVLRLEELCMRASWRKRLYMRHMRPDLISDAFEAPCRGLNPGCT